MKPLRMGAILAAALSCSTSFAATDCSSLVSKIVSERTATGSVIHVTMSIGADFSVDAKDEAWRREVTGFASMSKATAQPVTARFAQSGLHCEDAHGRTDLISFALGSDETLIAPTPPAAMQGNSAAPAGRK